VQKQWLKTKVELRKEAMRYKRAVQIMEVEFVTLDYLRTLDMEVKKSRVDDIDRHCRLARYWLRSGRYQRLKKRRDKLEFLFLFLAQQKILREEGKSYVKVLDLRGSLKKIKRRR
jgi:hypothetical protein